jgi:hypothetical protein
MPFQKGISGNPKGKPKGARDKYPREIVEKIKAINSELDSQGKGLGACAKQNPEWFHSIFTKAIIPKDVNVQVDGDLKISWEK